MLLFFSFECWLLFLMKLNKGVTASLIGLDGFSLHANYATQCRFHWLRDFWKHVSNVLSRSSLFLNCVNFHTYSSSCVKAYISWKAHAYPEISASVGLQLGKATRVGYMSWQNADVHGFLPQKVFAAVWLVAWPDSSQGSRLTTKHVLSSVL